jgi:hypothetical protein
VLSTWYFDHFTDGEWAGIDAAFKVKPDWVDLLMADDYGDLFPPYPLRHGVPGGFKMVGFPEISMYNSNPWGGYGANPFPAHIQSLWDQASKYLSGGFPYSEGIFEDLNKAVMAQCYWNPAKPVSETVREYLVSIGITDTDKAARAVEILENALPHFINTENGTRRVSCGNMENAVMAEQIFKDIDAELPEWAKSAWRWRILFLRATIDAELARNNFNITTICDDAFNELTDIYHAQQAECYVAPPVRK